MGLRDTVCHCVSAVRGLARPAAPPRWPGLLVRLGAGAALAAAGAGLLAGLHGVSLPGLPLRKATPAAPRRVVLAPPWPGWQRQVEVAEPAALRRWGQAWQRARRLAAPRPVRGPWARWVVQLDFGPEGHRRLWVLPDGRLWEPEAEQVMEAAALQEAVAQLGWRFREAVFGEALAWPEPGRLIPVGGRFALEDVRSGRWLQVVRYGGHHHVDVEPASRADTAVLRELFGGSWSWRRRPVVAVVGERRLAGSINGMPHGGGSVARNDFPGHFCLHFPGSWLHLRGRPDPSHQLMARQAAGQLVETLERASPHELVRWLLAAVLEGDEATLMYATEDFEPGLARRLVETVHNVVVLGLREQAGAEPTVQADVVVYRHPAPQLGYPVSLRLRLRPRMPDGPWRGWVASLPDLEGLVAPLAGARPLLRSGGYRGC